jgi:nitrogen regulatory protein P-II 1
MKKIEAIIRKSKFEEVKEALHNADIQWFSYWDITGAGKEKEDMVVRGQLFQSSFIQRRMLSVVVRDQNLEKTIKAIMDVAWTGELGDGKIFVSTIEETYRIRNGQKGPESLYKSKIYLLFYHYCIS